MLLALSSAQTTQPHSPSPASVDPADVEFFLEDDLDPELSWAYSMDVDEFTDEVQHWAIVRASEGTGFIAVGCSEDDDSIVVAVSTGIALDTKEDQFDRKPIRYRVDKNPTVSERWPGAAFSFANEPRSTRFARALFDGVGEVLVELTAWDGDTQRARFPLRDAVMAIGQVFIPCGETIW